MHLRGLRAALRCGVGVRYEGSTSAALSGIDLTLPRRSGGARWVPGSGKPPVNLLPRFVDASSGQVTLDGTPAARLEHRHLRKQPAMVEPDVVMLNESSA